MTDISESKSEKYSNELYVVKLEHELAQAKRAHKFDESLWLEKESSLNSIVSEQRKVISLLETLLSNNHQLIEAFQTSVTQQNDRFESINAEVEKSFDITTQHVNFLKQATEKTESLLGKKEAEINSCKKQIESLMTQVEANSMWKLEYERNESSITLLKDECKRLQQLIDQMEIERKSFVNDIASGKKYKIATEQKLVKLHVALQQRDSELADIKSQARNAERFLEQELDASKGVIAELENQRTSLEINLKQIQESHSSTEKEKQHLAETLAAIKIKMNGLYAREAKYKKIIGELDEKIIEARDKAQQTISFQLGYAFIKAGKSIGGFFELPRTLMQIRRDAKKRRKNSLVPKVGISPVLKEESVLSPMWDGVKFASVDGVKPKLKIAGVMDEFTYHSYAPEAEVLQLHPENWEQQLHDFKPDLLFIESAWQGLDGLWKTKISNAKEEIQGALHWCRSNNIPSMFWNKEDPVHFGTFLPIAGMVDFVFTTDIDCIPKYKQRLGHNHVYLLPFAAQPKTHNPIEKFERKDAFNFAGSYYLRYPERQRDFASLMDTVQQFREVEIYDRNYDNPHPHYTFPEKYKRFILGKLPFAEIDKAYKGYRYGINMNTIKQSQTMFARRVFELLASNTVVVSNFARGVRLLFGDLVVSSDNALQLKNQLNLICKEETNYRRFRLLGLRKVLTEHTYSHRLAYIRAKLTSTPYVISRPQICVIAKVDGKESFEKIKENFNRQNYAQKLLCVIVDGLEFDDMSTEQTAVFIRSKHDIINMLNKLPANSFISVFNPDDYYGPNYLEDLELATVYSEASAIGKKAFYSGESGKPELVNDGVQYTLVSELPIRSSIFKISALTDDHLQKMMDSVDVGLKLEHMLAVDEFNYCRSTQTLEHKDIIDVVNDITVADAGVSYMNQLIFVSENLPSANESDDLVATDNEPKLSGSQLFEFIPKPLSSAIQFSMHGDRFKIVSKLPADKHAYVYTQKRFKREELNLVLNSQFKLECKGTLTAMTVFEFQDKDGKKIAHSMNNLGDAHALAIPEHCVFVRFGLKLQASGQLLIDRLVLGTKNETPFAIIGKSRSLVVSKQYPDYDDLYKYGFVHSRIRAYKNAGALTDIFRVVNQTRSHYREFEGIDVASGDYTLLNSTLCTQQFNKILIHILDEKIWEVVKHHLNTTQIFIWVHGSEIQHWKRRSFEFKNMTDAEITRQKRLSDRRIKFWREVFALDHKNLHFIFVSQWLVDSTEEDLSVKIPLSRYSVINNFIDGNIFKFHKKTADDRLNLLSIRPYAKLVYANDLTVSTIMELSKRPFFSELKFTLIGDGELFDETVKPLVGFSNVTLKKQFLTHAEIASYHRQNGVFLVPTRMDTQGVSRDEAMSSGLVAITTNVAAIPEFVNNDVAMVVDAEDYKGMADAVELLYRNKDRYLELSEKASMNVAKKCGFDNTLQHELALISQVNVV